MRNTKPPLVVISGPTAVGKTGLSIALAKELEGEIVSADSMQVYRGMDIGTAKITKDEMQGIPHHLIDCLSPTEEFHVARFAAMAKQKIQEIYSRHKLPILVGGTGFYIQAVLYDIDFTEQEEDNAYRCFLQELAKEQGVQVLHEMLAARDPQAAEAIHPNNVKRVIRAIEFYEKSGQRISEHNEQQRQRPSPYRHCYFILDDDRERLYRRIEERVDDMLSRGLVEEVRSLLRQGVSRTSTAMQGIGYKEIADFLIGECSYEEAVCRLKRDTRHFAKRQLTWFRREPETIWLDRRVLKNEEALLDAALAAIREKEIPMARR